MYSEPRSQPSTKENYQNITDTKKLLLSNFLVSVILIVFFKSLSPLPEAATLGVVVTDSTTEIDSGNSQESLDPISRNISRNTCVRARTQSGRLRLWCCHWKTERLLWKFLRFLTQQNTAVAGLKFLHCRRFREGFKTPSHGKCPLGGYPPPRGLNGQDFSVKLAKKNFTDKGGTPLADFPAVFFHISFGICHGTQIDKSK